MAGGADQVEVARMAVRRLEARAPFAEIDLARDAGVHHPLQRAIDRRAADAGILAADEIEEIVGADVAFLGQKNTSGSDRACWSAFRPRDGEGKGPEADVSIW